MPRALLHPLPYQADPADCFARIHQATGALLLDSGRPRAERGRFDLLSAWPDQLLQPAAGENGRDFLARCRTALASLTPAEPPEGIELPFTGGLLGLLGYDFGQRLEHLPAQAAAPFSTPDAQLGLYRWALISDHQARSSQLVFHPSLPEARRAALIALFQAPIAAPPTRFQLRAAFQAEQDAHHYQAAIARIHDYIRAGDCYQVNFAQRFHAPCQGDPWDAYLQLRAACPTPFAGYLKLPAGALLSLSPERFLSVHRRQVESRPIKGTRPRGNTPASDRALADALLASAKDRAENLMIVDLLRNDLGRSCRTGSVRVPELFALESYPNVHHLVSAVTGQLADGLDAFDLLAGSFPGGSITGAPKIRAMQIIDELEPTRRSVYCGSLLYLDCRGEMDSSICIRSLLVEDGQIHCWGGGGIVLDSDWRDEYAESQTKVQLLLDTLNRSLTH